MKKIVDFFVPRETKFFDLLASQSENIMAASRLLEEFLKNYNTITDLQRQEYTAKIYTLHVKGDAFTHTLIELLHHSFITPLDREDIHQLATCLDDILDFIDLSAKRIVLYKLHSCTGSMVELGVIVTKSVHHIHECMKHLSTLASLKHHYVSIHELENQADVLHDLALSELFDGPAYKNANAVTILKLKDIYEFLETITGKCEFAAHIIEGIVVKHS